jgi:hypothetical protein
MSGITQTPAPGADALSWLAQRCDAFAARVDRAFGAAERRLGGFGACVLFGLVLLAAAAVYCAPAVDLINHGILYGEFSADPFKESLTSPIRLRPLSPWLAYVLLLRGKAFMAFPLLAGVLFLAVILRASRKQGMSGAESLGMGALMAFASPILFTLHFAGYVDTISYLFIALAVVGVGSDLVVAACVGLMLLNHDANLFVLPWLFFHAGRKRESWGRRARLAVVVGAALVAVALVRSAITSRAPVEWQPSFYLNLAYLKENALLNVRGTWLGLFMAFKLFWVIPIFAALDLAVKRRRVELFDLSLAVVCGLATMLITSDSSRLPALAFPAVLLGAAQLRETVLTPPRFLRVLSVLVLLNLFVPQYYVGQSKPIVFFPLPVALVLRACGYDPWTDWLGARQMHFSQE